MKNCICVAVLGYPSCPVHGGPKVSRETHVRLPAENGGPVLAFARTPATEGRDYVVRFADKGSWLDLRGKRCSVHSANVFPDSWENRWPVTLTSDAVDLAFVKTLGLKEA